MTPKIKKIIAREGLIITAFVIGFILNPFLMKINFYSRDAFEK